MTLEEFRAREKAQEDWAPGWEAIDAAFSALYPGQEPDHYGTLLPTRDGYRGAARLHTKTVDEMQKDRAAATRNASEADKAKKD